MLHLLGLYGLALVYLAFPAHGALVKRSAYQCNSSIANTYCRNHIESSRNPSGNCIDGVIMCYMTSPICRNAADCVAACRPLKHKGIYVGAQCVRNQCRCQVSDECTQDSCLKWCMIHHRKKGVQSWECLSNNRCICRYSDPCTGPADCEIPCAKMYPGKTILSTRCGMLRECLCEYLPGGTGTAIRPSVLTIAIILLTTLAMIPAPAEGKLGALLIPSAIFGFSTSQLAFG